jgi:hypothetical protein
MSAGRYDIKGLDTEDTSVHTVDLSSCSSFSDRLPPDTSNQGKKFRRNSAKNPKYHCYRRVPKKITYRSNFSAEFGLRARSRAKRPKTSIPVMQPKIYPQQPPTKL